MVSLIVAHVWQPASARTGVFVVAGALRGEGGQQPSLHDGPSDARLLASSAQKLRCRELALLFIITAIDSSNIITTIEMGRN